MSYPLNQFAEKFQLARQIALQEKPQSGLCGFELEWNLLDSQFRPLLTVGAGPARQSFVDYLRAECLSPWARQYSQLEVFHWMIEWATRPYYTPRGAVYEGRFMEGVLLNALHKAGRQFGEGLYAWHGNLLSIASVGHDSIPGAWHIAKRRYLERCVDLYGESLATAGIHANLSLPDALFAWDFMHLAPSERGDAHLDNFKSEFYITATRLMRAFAALFIAITASTPLRAEKRSAHGQTAAVLSEYDSVRSLTFPNPPALDLPNLYRSYNDYLQISYDLVRRGVRFGNNNWTPVRARSFAEPVERIITMTSEQLGEIYARGLYALGQSQPMEDMARQIEMQNLLARINLPMGRVEIRTDDGGHPLEVDIANLTLRHLLLLRFYADPQFARSFRYDTEDIARARRNEELAARHGLRAEIENPLNGKPLVLREFLRWTLEEVRPLAEILGYWDDLAALVEMAAGAPNTAEKLRARLRAELGESEVVPPEILIALAEERRAQVARDVEMIADRVGVALSLSKGTAEGLTSQKLATLDESAKLGEFIQRCRDEAKQELLPPVRFSPRPNALLEMTYSDKTAEILDLARQLVGIASVTVGGEERPAEIRRAATLIYDYMYNHGLGVRFYDGKYPAILSGFPSQMRAPVMLSGHFDVVAPEPDDSQFEPRVEGDYLWGRGAADMKTVVATFLVWMKDAFRNGPPYPPVNLLLVGNEENGEAEPIGTPHALKILAEDNGGYGPRLLIAGERTGERGDELWGEICTQNRGILRLEIAARDQRGHSGVSAARAGLVERLLAARAELKAMLEQRLTLNSPDGWQSQVSYPFIQIGRPGVYNLTPDLGLLGVEIRPIPQDDALALSAELRCWCEREGLELNISVMENGIACSHENPYLLSLIAAVRSASGQEPRLGRKLPATSARFAPNGQGVVWGQSGLAPHAKDERHYIPSILPYYRALQEFGSALSVEREN